MILFGKHEDPSISTLLDLHDQISDKGVPYVFSDAHQLLTDFFTEVDHVLQEIRGS